MKSNPFNYSLLAVGVAAVMGLSTGANAATPPAAITSGAAPINNVATASYNVGGVGQPTVTSNTVTVNVSETANFALVSTIVDTDNNPDTAINQTATPGGTTTFTHALTNTGNVTDTYTVRTTGDNSSLVTANPDYALGTSNAITYTLVQANGDPLTSAQITALNGQAQTGTLTNGGAIRIQPGLRANLSYAASTPDIRNGNDKGVGTLTATSTFFTTNNATNPTLINENQTIVRLPTYKITKTASNNVDLTATNPQVDYSINVTNATTDYSNTATNFVIRDVLPVGMNLPNGASSVTASNGATVTTSVVNGRTVIDVAVSSLAVNASQLISFKVNVDKEQYKGANASATNDVAVYDKFIGNVGTLPANPVAGTNYDILDSTDITKDVTRVPKAADEAGGAGEDKAATTTFTKRSLTLEQATLREIAPTTTTDGTNTNGQVTHVATITNTGQDIEGNAANPLTLTFTDGNNAAVDPVITQFFFVYTPPNADGTPGNTSSAQIPVTPTKSGNVYTISSNQFPGNGVGIAPGGKLEVSYNMGSTAAPVGSSENTVVKLTAAGTNAPTIAPITDTTNVKGLTLLKQAAVQVDCTGAIPPYQGTLGNPTTISDTAKPGDCIYYKITASNTFTTASGTAINNVVLSDLTSQWKPKSTYQPTTASSTGNAVTVANTGNATTEAVTATLPTLAAGASGNMTFAIKVNP